jgi:ATP-dependent Clp protease ATP-binding subunit ClpC
MDLLSFLDYNNLPIILITTPIIALIFFLWKKTPFENFISSGTFILDSFSQDLTKAVEEGKLDPVIGRKEEIEQVAIILGRRTKNNVILVGEAGVGKTAIVEGIAQRIFKKEVPKDLQHKRVLALDLNALMAGTKYRGEFESRMKKMLEEIEHSGRNIILFIDEIHNLMIMENSAETLSVSDILKPAMARGELQIIGASTPIEYKKYFQNDPAFERRLQPITINEPTKAETLEILKGVKKKYEIYHEVSIPDKVLEFCVEKASKILPDRSFPDKAIDLMDEAASNLKIKSARLLKVKKNIRLTEKDVLEVAKKYA